MSLVNSLTFLFIFMSFVDLNMAEPSFVCNKGMFLHGQTQTEFRVQQENCLDPMIPCENCSPKCPTNYTDKVTKFAKKVSGPFNISWMMIGIETSYLTEYLMEYGNSVQPSNEILTFSLEEKAISMKGWYKVILQCEMTEFAKVNVILYVPHRNRSLDITPPPTFLTCSSKIVASNSISGIPLSADIQNQGSQEIREPINAGIVVAIVLAGSFTLFMISAAVYMFKAVKKRKKDMQTNHSEHVQNNKDISKSTAEIMALNDAENNNCNITEADMNKMFQHRMDNDCRPTINSVSHHSSSALEQCNQAEPNQLSGCSMAHNHSPSKQFNKIQQDINQVDPDFRNFMPHYSSSCDQHNQAEPANSLHHRPDDRGSNSRQQIATDRPRHQQVSEQSDGLPYCYQMHLRFLNSEYC